jgi:hypothetical protein
MIKAKEEKILTKQEKVLKIKIKFDLYFKNI